MSTAKRTEYNPQNYDPKMEPAVINKFKTMNEEAENMELLPKSKILDDIMSPDEPWVGGCRYLLCFTPLFMHIEKGKTNYYTDESTREDFNDNFGLSGEDCELSILNRERIYKVLLTVTGMGLINHWSKTGHHQNYEMAKDYVARSMNFAGYKYDIVRGNDKVAVINKVKRMINSDIPVLALYKTGWELIIGYDENDSSLIFRKGNGVVTQKNYTDGLEYLICVTDIGEEKTDWKDIILDIIQTMETNDEGLGMEGYYEAIDFLLNDDFFNHADDKELSAIKQSLVGSYFIGHAEARGFSGQGFEWRFLNRYDEANKLADLYNKISYYGDQHHQIAWCGDAVFQMYGSDIRNRVIREKLVTVIYYMIENDMIICRLLKELIGQNTPDVLAPYDKKTGKIYSTQISTRDISLEEIMKQIKIKNTVEMDFNTDIEQSGNVEWKLEDGVLQIKGDNGVWDQDGITLKKGTNYPFKVDIRVKTNNSNIHLYYGNSYISFMQHQHDPEGLWIRDMLIGLYLGYPNKGIIPVNEFIDISWIVHSNFMAVIVNGEVRHYGVNYPYMNIIDSSNEKFRFGTANGSTITVEKIVISELQ